MAATTRKPTIVAAKTGLDYAKILTEAFALPAKDIRPSCCGRVYVCISTPGGLFPTPEQESIGKAHQQGIKAAAKKIGKIFQTKSHYGDRNALYVGYDNASGIELAKGEAIVAHLKSYGIACYRNEHGD